MKRLRVGDFAEEEKLKYWEVEGWRDLCSEMGRWKKYENCGWWRLANLLGTFDFKVWERKGGKGRWIVKPPAMARGCGIKVFALSFAFYVWTFFGTAGLVLCRPGGEQVINLVHFTSQLLWSTQVVNKWSQIPKTRPLVVQRYVARPYLINGD